MVDSRRVRCVAGNRFASFFSCCSFLFLHSVFGPFSKCCKPEIVKFEFEVIRTRFFFCSHSHIFAVQNLYFSSLCLDIFRRSFIMFHRQQHLVPDEELNAIRFFCCCCVCCVCSSSSVKWSFASCAYICSVCVRLDICCLLFFFFSALFLFLPCSSLKMQQIIWHRIEFKRSKRRQTAKKKCFARFKSAMKMFSESN